MCGENQNGLDVGANRLGSSPRVRGKPGAVGARRPRVRLIPACAGKTDAIQVLLSSSRAHPRVCGENRYNRTLAASVAGSSPRVRGKRAAGGTHFARTRLIPACAGKTGR